MNFWTFHNLAKTTGGTWRRAPADASAVLSAAAQDRGAILCHDTRELSQGQCYLAIKGENFDGHNFVENAFNQGASLAIVDLDAIQAHGFAQQRRGITTAPILEVPDTVKALQDLARAYRDALAVGGCKVIGVAGSNGKTTTRHLIHHVLTHAGRRGTQSPKSFNNHLGVPLTLLAARPTDDFVACEIGTNHPGEIDFLSAICRPDIAVIISIGEEHLEFFGDIEGVAKEESSIADHVQADGALFLGHGVASEVAGYLALGRTQNEFLLDTYEAACLPAYEAERGPHFWKNASIAGSIAEYFGIDHATIEDALNKFQSVPGRMQVFRFGQEVTVFHDAYNANPTSMSDMLEWFADGPGSYNSSCRKVLVIGDMLELGESAQSAHETLAELITTLYENQFDTIGVGPLCCRYLQGGACHTPFPEMLLSDMDPKSAQRVVALLQPGDTVLLKASRGMRLERLIPAIEARFGKAESDVS